MFDPTLIALWALLMVGVNIPTIILLRRKSKQWPMMVAAVLIAISSYGALEYCLSFGKPLSWELFMPEVVEVKSYHVQSNRYLYLWVIDGAGTPRYYIEPWGPKAASMVKGLKEAESINREMGFDNARIMYQPALDVNGGIYVDMPKPPPLKPKVQG